MLETFALDDPLDAATHADPYPYYATLRERAPLAWNQRRRLWVAADAASMDALLEMRGARVRPVDEPVPAWLDGTGAGDFFGALVRMNDGLRHEELRAYVQDRLQRLEDGAAPSVPDRLNDARALDAFIERFAVSCVGSSLGVAADALQHLFESVRALAAAFAPGATAGAITQGSQAALTLVGQFLAAGRTRDEAINDAGLLIQTYDATRGLISNTLVALARDRCALELVRRERANVPSIVQETARLDSPVQNTRRFLAEDATIGKTRMRKGDAVLLLLASANHDPAATCVYTFGRGVHACVGTRLATGIAAAGVNAVLDSGTDVAAMCEPASYKPSPNARIALFATP